MFTRYGVELSQSERWWVLLLHDYSEQVREPGDIIVR